MTWRAIEAVQLTTITKLDKNFLFYVTESGHFLNCEGSGLYQLQSCCKLEYVVLKYFVHYQSPLP